jgi:DNA-binding protein YbaB
LTRERDGATYVETSRDASLVVEVDRRGAVVRVQLEPDVTRDWDAATLAERILGLYRLAVLRSRSEAREQMNALGADLAPTPTYPSRAEVERLRGDIDF